MEIKLTNNNQFEEDGYIFIPKLVANPESLYFKPLINDDGYGMSGSIFFKKNHAEYRKDDGQVQNSFSRYNYPAYKNAYEVIQKEIERILQIDLFPTYYFERFYYVGSELVRHRDRPACEISVTLQISSNTTSWPIWFQKPDGSESCAIMNDGDAVLYKGCEIDHWRHPLKSRYNKLQNFYRSFRKKGDDTYHHQIFLHYVSAQGHNVHHAFDN